MCTLANSMHPTSPGSMAWWRSDRTFPQAEIDAFLDAVGLENIGGTITVEGNGD